MAAKKNLEGAVHVFELMIYVEIVLVFFSTTTMSPCVGLRVYVGERPGFLGGTKVI